MISGSPSPILLQCPMKSRDAFQPYELCRLVLDAYDGRLDPLMSAVGRGETHWLEFKAACEPPPPEGESSGQVRPSDDHRWHLARAVIALANTHGGCVLLGVTDEGEPADLQLSDPGAILERGGMDAFLRHLEDAVLKRPKGWTLANGRRVTESGLVEKGLVEYRRATLAGSPVVAILVRPIPKGEPCIYCKSESAGNQRHFLPVRRLGQVGRVRELDDPREMYCWQIERRPSATDLSELWQRVGPLRDGNSATIKATATVLILGVLVAIIAIFSSVAPEPKPPEAAEPFASLVIRSALIHFKGEQDALTREHVGGLARILADPAFEFDPESGWRNWLEKVRVPFRTSSKSHGNLRFLPWPAKAEADPEGMGEDPDPESPDNGQQAGEAEQDAGSSDPALQFSWIVQGGKSDLIIEVIAHATLAGIGEGEIEAEILDGLRDLGLELGPDPEEQRE